MECYARPPDALANKKPMDKTWRTWKHEFMIFLKAAGFDDKSSSGKACFLLNKTGKVGIEAMQDMKFDCEDDKQNYHVLLQKFDEHFDPPKNDVQERYNFYSRSRKNNESIDDYIADLEEKVKTCNFDHLAESMIRDVVIMDIKDENLRKIVFEQKNLDLNKLIITYKQYELNMEKMKALAISKENNQPNKQSEESNISTNKKDSKNGCSKCGTCHPFRCCPAFQKICHRCSERGHFAYKCPKNKSIATTNEPKKKDTKEDVMKNNIFLDSKNKLEKSKNFK